MLSLDLERDSRKSIVMDSFFSGLALLFCFLQRKDTGICILCFWALALFYLLIKYKKRNLLKKTGIILLSTTIALSAVWGTSLWNDSIRHHSESEEFLDFNTSRSNYIDYPHQSYDENPQRYQAVGWDRSLAVLVDNWFFMDERVNTQALKALSGLNDITEEREIGLKTKIYNMLKTGWNELRSNQRYYPILIMLFLIAVLLIVFFIINRNKPLEFFVAICSILGAILLCCYLCWQGRFLFRTFDIIAIPLVIYLIIMSIDIFTPSSNSSKIKWRIFGGILGLLYLVPCVWNAFLEYDPQANTIKLESIRKTNILETYIAQNESNLYIGDFSVMDNINPYVHFDGQYPSNFMAWGGSTYYSNIYYRTLENNGRVSLYADAFLEDHVYYVTTVESIQSALFLEYMYKKYGTMKCKVVKQIEGTQIVICKIIPEISENKLSDGLYQWDDYCFYLEDKKPLRGSFFKSGQTYQTTNSTIVCTDSDGVNWLMPRGLIIEVGDE